MSGASNPTFPTPGMWVSTLKERALLMRPVTAFTELMTALIGALIHPTSFLVVRHVIDRGIVGVCRFLLLRLLR